MTQIKGICREVQEKRRSAEFVRTDRHILLRGLLSRGSDPSSPRPSDIQRSRLLDGVLTLENPDNASARMPGSSRAVNVDAALQVVAALCEQHSISISTIEPLQSGGTRVVLNTSGEADEVRRRMKSKLIEGPVMRSSLHVARKSAPYR